MLIAGAGVIHKFHVHLRAVSLWSSPLVPWLCLTDCRRLVLMVVAIGWKALHFVFKEGCRGKKEEPHPFQTTIRAYLKKSRREIKDYSRGLQTWAVSGSGKRMSPESPCFVSTSSFCILWHYESNPYEVETEVWIVAIFELVLAVGMVLGVAVCHQNSRCLISTAITRKSN